MGKQNGAPKKRLRMWLLAAVVIAVAVPLLVVAVKRLEGTSPQLALVAFSPAMGTEQTISGTAADTHSGIRRIWIALVKDGKEQVVYDRSFAGGGIWPDGDAGAIPFEVTIRPETLGFTDGDALLRVAAWDHSWRGWGTGTPAYLEKNVVIDTKAPEISVLTRVHNIAQGGTGLLRYRLSERCPKSGVTVGERFYPGHPAGDGDMLAFFAVAHDQPTEVAMAVTAVDAAGNTGRAGFPHHVRRTRFKKDTINLSQRFLSWKMPDFYPGQAAADGPGLLDQFLRVNGDMRRENYETIVDVTARSDDARHWNGAFVRMPGATRATFGDRRAYRYRNETVDHQTHLGVDLASLAHSPVPAANAGRVAFTGAIGIYGKTVIIDHGFGLFSLYSHLNEIGVAPGQRVRKDDTIGRTGTTGLAGGDHLHFSMLVGPTFVNPLEWWDPHWITNNIGGKLPPAS